MDSRSMPVNSRNYKQILRSVGIIWIAFGLVDIIYFIGHTANGYIASHTNASPAWESFAIVYSTLNRGNAVEAERRACVQLGDRYTYHTTGIRWSGNRVIATVIAYSDDEIRYTEVNWEKR